MSGGWGKWDFNVTGLTDSPYHVCQSAMWDKITAMGNQPDSNNTFAW